MSRAEALDELLELTREPKITYFSMEISVHNDIATYSGGLGVLAGDTIRSAADLKLPLVAVTILTKKGYFNQDINPAGLQVEYPDDWNPSEFMILLPHKVSVEIEGKEITIQAWQYTVKSLATGSIPVFFLDTDLPANNPEHREITSRLYGGDEAYRLKQEIVSSLSAASACCMNLGSK